MKTTPCYKQKNKEDHVLMIKLLYSLGYKMEDAETPDICEEKYSFYSGIYNFLEHPNKFNGNFNLEYVKNAEIFPTLGAFIEAAIEWLKPEVVTVKLDRGVDAIFKETGAEFNANGFFINLSINDIEKLYQAAQEYKQSKIT